MEILLAKPRGFCAGVKRAISTVEKALEIYGRPVFVLHEIVHNRHVIQTLSTKGAIFVEELEEIPKGSITIFSAHGVSEETVIKAASRGLRVIDATCPLVTKVHMQARRYSAKGMEVIIIGHPGHPEVEGTQGWVKGLVSVIATRRDAEMFQPKADKLAYVTQTTLSIDDTREVIELLGQRFPHIRGPELNDICYATQNRQDAVKRLSQQIDLLLVVGSQNSSNSNRLRETGLHQGLPSYLIENKDNIQTKWFAGMERIGITAGASAPEILVQEVIDELKDLFDCTVKEIVGEEETIEFRLPKMQF